MTYPVLNGQGKLIHYEAPARMQNIQDSLWMSAQEFMPWASRLGLTERIERHAGHLTDLGERAVTAHRDRADILRLGESGRDRLDRGASDPRESCGDLLALPRSGEGERDAGVLLVHGDAADVARELHDERVGDGLVEDAAAVRAFLHAGGECLVASSGSKNFALYDERIGALAIVGADASAATTLLSHVKALVRTTWSNPPAHGGEITEQRDAGQSRHAPGEAHHQSGHRAGLRRGKEPLGHGQQGGIEHPLAIVKGRSKLRQSLLVASICLNTFGIFPRQVVS